MQLLRVPPMLLNKMTISCFTKALAVTAAAVLVASCAPAPGELVVYSSRVENLIKPLFDRYTAETGTPVVFVTDDAGPLIERLAAEGENSPADVLITVDAGQLWFAAERGLLQPVESAVLANSIPASFRDPGNRWFGFSLRARTIAYSSERVDPAQLSTYADLADPKWRGKLCLRTSKQIYNQSLVAMLIAELGVERTEEIVRGWVANLATDVFSSDTRLLEAIAAGQCDVGLVNTYYFGRMQRDNPAVPVKLFWPDQEGSGVHVNVSGAGITAHAPHAAEARRFLEWLAGPQAQAMFAASNLEFPVSPSVQPDPLVAAWGTFKQNPINVAKAGELQAEAVRLMDRVGYP
jgi:iron(III) transport system substrate-binding protein